VTLNTSIWITQPANLCTICTSLKSTEPGRSFCHSYYGRWIGNRTQAFVRRHFQRPWRTPTPGFKVTTLFDAEYLRNGMRCRHSFNGILTGAYIRPTQQCQMILSDLEWLSKIFNDSKHHLCDSRATCYPPSRLGSSPGTLGTTVGLEELESVQNYVAVRTAWSTWQTAMSARVSVCHAPVSCRNGLTHHHLITLAGPIILVWPVSLLNTFIKFWRDHPLQGEALNAGGVCKFRDLRPVSGSRWETMWNRTL